MDLYEYPPGFVMQAPALITEKGRMRMEVRLLTSSASMKDMEQYAALAALTCHANTEKSYVPQEVLGRIIKLGHESILEHINLTYSVKSLSRACLQELARHRHISLSVESTRHTLKKVIDDPDGVYVLTESIPPKYHGALHDFLEFAYENGDITANDELKYYLPEFWPTNLILTANIRALRHILKLRTAPAALNEFRVLAYSLYEAVPEASKYLLEDCVYKEEKA